MEKAVSCLAGGDGSAILKSGITEAQKNYRFRKAQAIARNVCFNCGTPLQEFDYKRFCLSCVEEMNHYHREWWQRQSEEKKAELRKKRNDLYKKTYELRKAEHKCTKCGKQLPTIYGYIDCPMCRQKGKEKMVRYRARKQEAMASNETPLEKKHKEAEELARIDEVIRNEVKTEVKKPALKKPKLQIPKIKKSQESIIVEKPKRALTEAQLEHLAKERAQLKKDKEEAIKLAQGMRAERRRIRQQLEKDNKERLAQLDKYVADLAR